MKKIGLICLCLASLSLAGCFHIPDEDWLPSRNKVKTEDVEKNIEFEQAVDSFMDGVNMISSEWDEIKNEESNEMENEGIDEVIETDEQSVNDEEIVKSEKIADDEVENTVE